MNCQNLYKNTINNWEGLVGIKKVFNKMLCLAWAQVDEPAIAKPFLTWGQFCAVRSAHTAKLTWQMSNFSRLRRNSDNKPPHNPWHQPFDKNLYFPIPNVVAPESVLEILCWPELNLRPKSKLMANFKLRAYSMSF